MESDPPDRGVAGPRFRMVIASIWIIDPLEMLMPLFPVRLPPSMMPPEIEMFLCEPDADLMAALAAVEELIWIVPCNSTQVFEDNVSDVAPTVKVPLRWSTMTSPGF